MTEKENEIKDLAMKLFFKYGYPKVTMSDIADAAGISRPTLYKSFASKEDIFSALAVDEIEKHKVTSQNRIKNIKSLEEKLEQLFEIWILAPYASTISAEYGRDLLENCGKYAPDAIAKVYA